MQVVIDWSDACVKDSQTGKVIPIRQAVREGMISRETGDLLNQKLDALTPKTHEPKVREATMC